MVVQNSGVGPAKTRGPKTANIRPALRRRRRRDVIRVNIFGVEQTVNKREILKYERSYISPNLSNFGLQTAEIPWLIFTYPRILSLSAYWQVIERNST